MRLRLHAYRHSSALKTAESYNCGQFTCSCAIHCLRDLCQYRIDACAGNSLATSLQPSTDSNCSFLSYAYDDDYGCYAAQVITLYPTCTPHISAGTPFPCVCDNTPITASCKGNACAASMAVHAQNRESVKAQKAGRYGSHRLKVYAICVSI